MAMELNLVLDKYVDPDTGRPFLPSVSGECAFLKMVVVPIFRVIDGEVGGGGNGNPPRSAWRNYDDVNEYFWSRRCLMRLKWPLDLEYLFFETNPKKKKKTGFVETRSFWNVFRSFHRLWVVLVLFLQALVIVAWEGTTSSPWDALWRRGVQVKLLSVFVTWGGLSLLQSVVDAWTHCGLVSMETVWLGVRMVLKIMVATTWTLAFGVLYARIWIQKGSDPTWSHEANQRIITFLKVVLFFLVPKLLSLVLFMVPWLRNLFEESDSRVLNLLTWWFQTRIFVGRGMREGLVDTIKYTLFWISVLASKFSFSYFVQIKPLVATTKTLLNLKGVTYKWHEIFTNNNIPAIILLWLPVVLIYLVDLQIWFSIFSSLVGAMIGLFSYLGVIRNITQLKHIFQLFAGAMQFNLMPEKKLQNQQATLQKKLRDGIHRLKLQFGVGQPFKKIESSQVDDATKFAIIWNEIVTTFREEDLISDRELELLEMHPNCWNIRVIQWPCFLICDQLLRALSKAQEMEDEADFGLWLRICKNEYRRCAVIEAYDSIKYLLLRILKVHKEEHSTVTNIFRDIDSYIQTGKLTESYNMSVLPDIHAKVCEFVQELIQPKRDIIKAVILLQDLYKLFLLEFPKVRKSIFQLNEEGLARSSSATCEGLLFENAIEIPDAEDEEFARQLRRLHTILTCQDSMHNVPLNLEARRRIAFFCNSMFMNMPRAPPVEKMMAFSILTPYCGEQVMYSKEILQKKNERGITTLYYLQKIYEDEWKNFMERMHREGLKDEEDIWITNARDMRLWASYRGQTLSRLVRGMMYYYRALKMLAFLDSASEMDIRQRSTKQECSLDGLHSDRSVVPLSNGHDEYGSAVMKFTYVVACKMYGDYKAEKDPRAEEILYLMKSNEALRVAYVDKVRLRMDETEYHSVLVKYDQQLQREVEIYRIKLPGPLKYGEGKPENQNHALIFTRGDALQTIDMNQDNYFEEAIKMRNLLEEFNAYHGIRRPTIVGVREKIFTESVSSLACFKSAQETSFVTLGQRVLANPLKVRMHYGHSDVFDRFWFLSRGGVSKPSRVINISEGTFAGFNCTLRGGCVTHHEYIQVGKGSDVGLNQISMFEAKVASDNGEQLLSRDLYRLGQKLSFFRMLSVFYTTVGFYFNSMVVVLTVYVFLWGRLYMAVSGLEEKDVNSASNNKALGAILIQQFMVQLGLFTVLPTIVENSVEHGFLQAVWDFFTMKLQLSSLFYAFSLGTHTHFFARNVLHGGAKYRASGPGSVVEVLQHKSFAENYRLYARSHFVKAIELAAILIVCAFHSPLPKDTFVYIAMTISGWFLVASWIMSPFVFNPSGFDWLNIAYDFNDFVSWIWYPGGVFRTAEHSWETWWYEEQGHLRTTSIWGKLMEIILALRFFFLQYGIVYQLAIASGSKTIAVYMLSWIYVAVAIGIYIIMAYAWDKFATKKHIYYRLVQLLVIVVTIHVIVLLPKFTHFKFIDHLTCLVAFIPTGWGMTLIGQVLRPFLQSTFMWGTIVSLARLYELLFGTVVMAPVAVLSWFPGFQCMQTQILFTEAFSMGVKVSRIFSGMKLV